jgi:RNase adaptor protein for sRNA GlmZ degradation
VRIQSFSYRNGIPGDEKGHGGGFIFDCRALPNPGKYEQFIQLSGNDPGVIAFLDKELEVARFMNHVQEIIDQAVENYQSRNFTDLLVAFGCTGGQHRSVYCANLLAGHLRQKYQVNVELQHRELQESET